MRTPSATSVPKAAAQPLSAARIAHREDFRALLAELRSRDGRERRAGPGQAEPEGRASIAVASDATLVPGIASSTSPLARTVAASTDRSGELAALIDRHGASLLVGRVREQGHAARIVLGRRTSPIEVRIEVEEGRLSLALVGDDRELDAFEPHLRRVLDEAGQAGHEVTRHA